MKKPEKINSKKQKNKKENNFDKQRGMQIYILDSIRALVFCKDKENRFIWVNRAFSEAMKMPKEKLEGKSLFDIYSKKIADNYWKADKEVFDSGKPKIGIVETIKSSKGNIVWLQTDKIPYRDAEENIIGIIGFSIDVTEQKNMENRLRENQEKFQAFFEYSSDPMMTLEYPEWKFTGGNLAALRLFGVDSVKEFSSLSPGELSPERQPDGELSIEKARRMLEKALEDGSNFFEWTHKKYKGKEFVATILLSRIQFKGKVFIQATIRDISTQKEAEIKLKEKMEEIEKMNKFMVGRELKMAELKEKIKKLEKIK